MIVSKILSIGHVFKCTVGGFVWAPISNSGGVSLSLQVPARVHLPLQAICITVLAAADAVGCALGRTSVQLAVAKVVAQTVLGGVLPSLVRTTRIRWPKMGIKLQHLLVLEVNFNLLTR